MSENKDMDLAMKKAETLVEALAYIQKFNRKIHIFIFGHFSGLLFSFEIGRAHV